MANQVYVEKTSPVRRRTSRAPQPILPPAPCCALSPELCALTLANESMTRATQLTSFKSRKVPKEKSYYPTPTKQRPSGNNPGVAIFSQAPHQENYPGGQCICLPPNK
jgi:hypothetical protein